MHHLSFSNLIAVLFDLLSELCPKIDSFLNCSFLDSSHIYNLLPKCLDITMSIMRIWLNVAVSVPLL